MVKITAKKKTKLSPVLLLAVVATVATIFYFSSVQPDDGSLGSLLAADFTGQNAVDSVAGGGEAQSSNSGASEASDSIPVHAVKPDVVAARVESNGETTAIAEEYKASSTSGLQPIRCQDFSKRGYVQAGEKKAEDPDLNPNNDQIHARLTRNYTNNFWISIHHATFDQAQFDDYFALNGHYNKTSLTTAALEIIASTPGRILDVGAQVGWFSLLARAAGREVDAFEPVKQNVFRLCESLFLNHWSNFVEEKYPGPFVNVHHVALNSEEEYTFEMQQTGASASMGSDGEKIEVPATTLDKFMEGRGWTNEPISLLKVNTMGMEDKILGGASTLLSSKMVKNVLLGTEDGSSGAAANVLLKAGYKLHKWGGPNGPNQDASGVATGEDGWMSTLTANVQGQIFLWFKI